MSLLTRHELIVQVLIEELLLYREQIDGDRPLRSVQIIIEFERGDTPAQIREAAVFLKYVRAHPSKGGRTRNLVPAQP